MKPKNWICAVRKGAPGATTLGFVLAFARTMQAQEQVLAPPPVYSLTPPAMQDYEAGQPGAPQVESLASVIDVPHWLEWGPVTLHPHLLYRFLYGSGIQSAPGQPQNTVIQQFSPGVLFAIGSHWTLDYTPLFSYYSSSNFQDSIDQSVALGWGTTYQDWTLGFSQTYRQSSAPLIQTGTQTDTDGYLTSANASYHFSSRMSVDLLISQNFLFADQFTSTRSWTTIDWVNFEPADRWDTGLGVSYEYDDVNPGPNTTSEGVQGRIRWRATGKTSFVIHGGVEDQQSLGGGASSLVTPIFGASIQYQPVDTTTLSLIADRSITPSFFQGQTTVNTSLGGSVNQQLLERVNLSVGVGYGRTSYLATTNIATAGTGRVDNNYYINVRLGTTFLTRGTAAVFYQYSDNPSTQPGFGFSSSQVGFELGYRY